MCFMFFFGAAGNLSNWRVGSEWKGDIEIVGVERRPSGIHFWYWAKDSGSWSLGWEETQIENEKLSIISQ